MAAYSTASMSSRALDDAAAEAALAVVEHGELPRSHRALRLLETHLERAVAPHGGKAALVRLPIAHLDVSIEIGGPRFHHPVARARQQRATREQGMIVPLHGNQLIALQVLRGHIPGIFRLAGAAADFEPTALSQCVE